MNYQTIEDAVKRLEPGFGMRISGSVGSSRSLIIARLLTKFKRPVVLFTADSKESSSFLTDLRFFLPDDIPVLNFSSIDVLPYYNLSPNPDAVMDRLGTLWKLHEIKGPHVLVASQKSVTRRLMPRSVFESRRKTLIKGDAPDRKSLIQSLIQLAYQRVPLVEDRGTFAVRGGIIDIFSPAHEGPCRLEFFGDTIESIRFFDPASQKTNTSTDQIIIIPAREILMDELPRDWKSRLKKRADSFDISKIERDRVQEMLDNQIYFNGIETYLPLFYKNLSTLFDFLPGDALSFFVDFREQVVRMTGIQKELGDHLQGSTSVEKVFVPDDIFLTADEFKEMGSFFPKIDFAEAGSSIDPSITLAVESNAVLSQKIGTTKNRDRALDPLVDELIEKRKRANHLFIVASSKVQGERLKDLLGRYDVPMEVTFDRSEIRRRVDRAVFSETPSPFVQVLTGPLSGGFYLPNEGQWWITDQEIFGEKTKRLPRREVGETFSSFSDLAAGDHVVHRDHGIGLYRGLTSLEIRNVKNDFLLLEYFGGDKLYVPVDQLDRLSRYSIREGQVPVLDKMGGTSWRRVREKVKKATRKLARELLQVQAKRLSAKGVAFSSRGTLFEEFEATFPYDETEDQLRAIEEVIVDMEKTQPMDRLVCGDVGYGKTEVAMRAAFKAVLDKKLVAILVPTTVLAFQHFETFRKRFANDAVEIDLLSRFQTRSQQAKVLERIRTGRTDIVIATHRLFSRDVELPNLGLLVVDEEHRFGVSQKEKIKKIRATVDILTLSATPIPRTLNFSLMGLRDLSIINTPPVDRLAIQTFATHFDEGLVREAIMREVKRGGQIYFIHNRIQTIASMKERLQKIVPEVRIEIGHGQMPEKDLERAMLGFMEKQFEVLLCTTIVESGLDIPLANTIIINRADHMGLAQLYQLRGRVGRSHHRASCYLLVPHDSLMTKSAKKRLSVIQRFTELGSGFKIASHDLEIRGAGNILGPEQSGQIAAVGYDLYVKLLEEAVMAIRGEAKEEIKTEIKLPVSSVIPEDFIPDTQLRLVLYKQLSSVNNLEGCDLLREEWIDRFGELPAPTENLISMIRVKILANQLGVLSVMSQKDGYVFEIHSKSPIPTDYFLTKSQKSPRKYRILRGARWMVMGLPESEDKILETAFNHLREMEQLLVARC